jgi:catechol 2,3-dioxygenase-like lactoylglutathione lyase family enzyme
LGLTVDRIVPHRLGGKIAFLNGSAGEAIELICYTNPKPIRPDVRERGNTGINHFGFKVDDAEAEYKRLKALGVEFEGEFRPASPGHPAAAHFWDPEGNRLHITQVDG